MTPFAKNIWLETGPAQILGMQLTSTMAVIRLDGDRLLVSSPLFLTGEIRARVDALGAVDEIFCPNTFHHLHAGQWQSAFPSARLHAPRGLTAKRPDLRIDRYHDEPADPAVDAHLLSIPIEGFHLEECVLIHRATQTLLVADLVHNVGRPQQAWAALYTRLMGFNDRVALSRMIRWTAFSNKSAARTSIDRILAEPIERLVVGHGKPLETGASEAIRSAFAWLA